MKNRLLSFQTIFCALVFVAPPVLAADAEKVTFVCDTNDAKAECNFKIIYARTAGPGMSGFKGFVLKDGEERVQRVVVGSDSYCVDKNKTRKTPDPTSCYKYAIHKGDNRP